jgi:hypothetical protein
LLDATFRILLLAIVAGASPMAIVATLAVLTSRRGRTNGIAFLAGFGLGQTTAFVIAYLAGSAATDQSSRGGTAVFELVVGIGLLALAWLQRRPRQPAAVTGPSRTEAVLRRLEGLRPATAFAVGTVLGVGGIKRLTITLVAGATVAVADLARVESLALGVLYVVVSGVLVWFPVTIYVIAGTRADAWMTSARDWVTANERRLTFYSTVVFGVLLTADAVLQLL